MQDAGIMEIVSNPEAYARYLRMQGDNPMYSAGNIALAMVQEPHATAIATQDRWKDLGRYVLDTERNEGIQIFTRAPLGKGYVITNAYDISQTGGRDVKRQALANDTPAMEKALAALLNYAVVPVVIDSELTVPAYYDYRKMELAIQPGFPDTEAFAAIAAEIAQCRFHAKGVNRTYNREESELDAESVSCILCKRFGIQRDLPNLENLTTLYEGWEPQEARQALTNIQEMSKQIGNSIERDISPKQHFRASMHRSAR